jgi:orotidine-5'-phosphate decarboxylase
MAGKPTRLAAPKSASLLHDGGLDLRSTHLSDPKIIVALDFADGTVALDFARRLRPDLCRLKVGKELFTAAGPALVAELQRSGFQIFLDLKFHDIPNTVAQACKAAAALGVWMLNLHALGGRAMMTSAREALGDSPERPRLTAVTVLTSMTSSDLAEVGVAAASPGEAALRLAKLSARCGMDGVVCSAEEARLLRAECGPDFLLVTPGIRPEGSAADDQKRIATPASALNNGASYLVVGRPITRAPDPLTALRTIVDTIHAG